MKLSKIGHAIQHIAPVAASLLSAGTLGPAGVGVGMAVKKALDLNPSTKDEEVVKAVTRADPTQLAKLKQIDADLIKDHRAVALKSEEIAAADRDSARKREIALHDKTPTILTFCVTGSLLSCIYLLVWMGDGIKSEVLTAITALTGALGAGMHTILQYYFGGSKGADASNAVVHEIAAAKGTTEA